MKPNNAAIRLRGVRQNNLKGFDLDIPLGKMTVVTGLSGSGKSSLVFDTLYAEGQRRYVETFSPYARQFLERLDPPRFDSIEGIPPAIAIQQGNTVKTSRSTVGTLTELCDYFKLLMPHRAQLFCPQCHQEVQHDTPQRVYQEALHFGLKSVLLCFPLSLQEVNASKLAQILMQQGYRRWWNGKEVQELDSLLQAPSPKLHASTLLVIQDRMDLSTSSRSRFFEAAETAFRAGKKRLSLISLEDRAEYKYSEGRHCARCDRSFPSPVPSLFSFNNPFGACPKCRGFGRTIEIDSELVMPNHSLSLRQGVVRPWQSGVSATCQQELLDYCSRRKIRVDVPFCDLPKEHKKWILEGDEKDPGETEYGPWYGVKGYFEWLESKSYKMHVRVLLSRYRAYRTCVACHGTRFQPETLNFKLSSKHLGELYSMPVRNLRAFMENMMTLNASSKSNDPTHLIEKEILSRLKLLGDVGLDYLTLDRTARTLSGGEVQRVHLTTCLGAAMVNTLFILDEPSVGLHPRDVERLIGVLRALRDRGNTLVIVEHEPAVIRSADYLVDLGPHSGQNGGELIFKGRTRANGAFPSSSSLTLEYLSGKRIIPIPLSRRSVDRSTPNLRIDEAKENNLKGIDVTIPLARFVCITGVSGSGKSTLVHRVLYENLQRARGAWTGNPGACGKISGGEKLREVVLVDQSPLGRSSRSNPVVYVGAWEPIRNLFSQLEESKRRAFVPSTFSFNSGEGRCSRCGGSGFEKIEMQFLADVIVACSECKGRRFKPEVLQVQLGSRNAAELLDLDITELRSHLSELSPPAHDGILWNRARDEAIRKLQLLERVGLGYLKAGQPSPTLSGGEAQRLKLCGFLSESHTGRSGGALLIFDEPTTGLHYDDVRQLLSVFQDLVDQGHSVIVIEHNLEVMKCADWIVDLGPGAGDEGGNVVVCGTPEIVAAHAQSETGKFLMAVLQASPFTLLENGKKELSLQKFSAKHDIPSGIRIQNAREHNLKNISLSIPLNQFVVITGLSGSGKSTLAFDLVFAEGQRRFLDCMSAYARQYIEQIPRPDLDLIEGIPPTVAIEQRITRGGWKSTVATITEAYHFIRLLYARVGTQCCPDCQVPIQSQSEDSAVLQVMEALKIQPRRLLAPAVRSRKGFHEEVIEWASDHGFKRLRIDGKLFPIDQLRGKRLERYVEHTIEIDCGVFDRGTKDRKQILHALRLGQGMLQLADPAAMRRGKEMVVSTSRVCPSCQRSFSPLDPKDFSFNSPGGWCTQCQGYGVVWNQTPLELLQGEEESFRDQQLERKSAGDGEEQPCPVCRGARLKRDSLSVFVHGLSLRDLNAMSSGAASRWFTKLKFKGQSAVLARDIIPQIAERLKFMDEVGLDYLALGRAAVTLSGGEAQRIRLASQLGSTLRGVLYVLDEPTIGLHPRDNERLLDVLDRLKKRGNSLLVVEHDKETMRRADWLIDLGPGAGKHGGEVVWSGPIPRESDGRTHSSRTLEALVNPMRHPLQGKRRPLEGVKFLALKNATLHNLKNVTAQFPAGRLTVVAGVSGAGKSSLVRGTLLDGIRNQKSKWRTSIQGRDLIASAYEVDQSPIGKTPRSCPGTYLGVWDEIRLLFAATSDARIRGYKASRFSFNVGGGRCSHCAGQGRVKLEMNFLPSTYVVCDLCEGCRFNSETLEIRYRDKTIAEVLNMSIEEAAEFFSFDRKIAMPLGLLRDTGLAYLTLGQSSPTLSGGEAQRLKLVSELMRGHGMQMTLFQHSGQKGNLYVLEEPTIGLHFADVEKLVGVLHRLVDAGHTVIVIEHNLDMIAEADYVIEVGPDGGERGGRIMAMGTPEKLVGLRNSITGRYLKEVLKRSKPRERSNTLTKGSKQLVLN